MSTKPAKDPKDKKAK